MAAMPSPPPSPLVRCLPLIATPILKQNKTAINAGMMLWVGVWNVDDAKFGREKAALEAAIRAYPETTKWLKGINVGSESLYRKEVSAQKLAGQIYGAVAWPRFAGPESMLS